ncbi:MAG: response regulator transcription factor [Chloroflexi bacterium]|nr:response regulator transcription factor [Chloroflexota bacterium]
MRILVADDHPVFRDGVIALLNTRKNFEVVGEANSGEDAVALARTLKPDLVLMDIHMPGLGGIEATRQIRAELRTVRVIMVTVSDNSEDLFEAVKAGAQGYIVKNLSSIEVLDLVEKAAMGEAAFTPVLASKALLALGGDLEQPAISPREQEVLEHLVQGYSNAIIAKKIGLSEATVRFHLRNILSKLQARSRTEAAVQALKRNLVRPPQQQKRE